MTNDVVTNYFWLSSSSMTEPTYNQSFRKWPYKNFHRVLQESDQLTWMNHLASKILTYHGDVEQHVQTHSILSNVTSKMQLTLRQAVRPVTAAPRQDKNKVF